MILVRRHIPTAQNWDGKWVPESWKTLGEFEDEDVFNAKAQDGTYAIYVPTEKADFAKKKKGPTPGESEAGLHDGYRFKKKVKVETPPPPRSELKAL